MIIFKPKETNMDYFVNCLLPTIEGTINLPTSKSISNRLLIIKALAGGSIDIGNISESDDTKVMLEAFKSSSSEINIGHAGTSMRFLTAFFAAKGMKKIITGSERMKNRPIAELVEGLNQLQADIQYLEKTGFPPIQTSGKPLKGNALNIKGSISSQFITAILLIAPTLPEGLTINITGKLISSSYVALTLGLMKGFGIDFVWKDNVISIAAQKYVPHNITVEADWSGASYWYEIAALASQASIRLNGITNPSLQGDAVVYELFERLGVASKFEENSVIITKTTPDCKFFEFDFINNPDLVQTFVVTLCLMAIPFRLMGADTLRVKETDRILALQNEMEKLGYIIQETSPGVLTWNGVKHPMKKNIAIHTYKDHRMALAFAPAALYTKKIIICDAMVVTKSYPRFWTDLSSVGFEVSQKLL